MNIDSIENELQACETNNELGQWAYWHGEAVIRELRRVMVRNATLSQRFRCDFCMRVVDVDNDAYYVEAGNDGKRGALFHMDCK